jgi:hypothetical protein
MPSLKTTMGIEVKLYIIQAFVLQAHNKIGKTLPLNIVPPAGDVIADVPNIGTVDILFGLREPPDPRLWAPRTLPALDDTCKYFMIEINLKIHILPLTEHDVHMQKT